MRKYKVSIARAEESSSGVTKALLNLNEIQAEITKCRQVLIKPNFVSTRVRLSATPIEAVRAAMDYLSKIYRGTFIIAEGPALGELRDGIERFRYTELLEYYDIELIDLNKDDGEDFLIWDSSLNRSVKIKVAKTILESDCIVSIVRPKTHDTVVVTLTIKNIVMGAVQRGYKSSVHQGYKGINVNLAYLATYMMPRLAIIDGYEGMQGNGPIGGYPATLGVSLAGLNALSVDAMCARLMGFNPLDIGYLYYLHRLKLGSIDIEDIEITGLTDWMKYVKKFVPHRSYREQLNWRLPPHMEERILEEILEEVKNR